MKSHIRIFYKVVGRLKDSSRKNTYGKGYKTAVKYKIGKLCINLFFLCKKE